MTDKKVYDFNKIQPLVVEKKEYKEWEGDKVSIEDLENKEFVIIDFDKMPSKTEYKALTPFYLTVQILLPDSKKAWFSTSSSVLMDLIEGNKQQLPYKVKLVKIKSKAGRKYWSFEQTVTK